tara:strand:+ start:14961 stop:16040 length:1080 start_codon:yes stop_codon:yes gene_type:complete
MDDDRFDATEEEVDVLRTYISRRAKKVGSSVVDETMHRGNLDPDVWESSIAWVKDKKTGVSALVKKKKKDGIDPKVVFQDMMKEVAELAVPVKAFKRELGGDPHCFVLDIADLHIGKLGVDGTYDVDTAVGRGIEGVAKLLNLSAPYQIDQIVFVIGNDILHTDNLTKGTSAGTPQDTDGHWYDAFKAARILYAHILQTLKEIAPVHVVHCPSNHDYMSGFMLAETLQGYFHKDENISFDIGMEHRKYYQYGNSMLAFSHGDGAKLDQVPYLAAHEAPQMWAGTEYRYGYLHHVHHYKKINFLSGEDFIGMTVDYVRSPSGTDRWHDNKGYKGAKIAMEGFLHSFDGGRVSKLTNNFTI